MKLATLILLVFTATTLAASAPSVAWPEPTSTNKPWTRWWWLGSAVDKENLTRLLEQYHDAGLGGVEICPIYGATGAEDRFIDFLSPTWMEMLAHTTSEARRLGMQVDLTTGTGWPFGGPMVSADDASAKVVMKAHDFAGGGKFDQPLPEGKLQCLRAVSDEKQIDLTKDRDQALPAGKWRVYALSEVAPIQKVKRAAPGGAGNVLDPYSVKAMDAYLAAFDKAFEGFSAPMPRAEFHDSFEYYGANWTDDFLDQFKQRRGYDLRTQLRALMGEASQEWNARVRHDYRETLSDLHLAYVHRWSEWSRKHGSLSRNQAHGAPGNLIDLYAAADIPETEIFGEVDERAIPMHKFATSAAHLTGRALASSESFTWLGEHFSVSLADVKPAADFLFLTGVNHIFFHGTPYSPKDADWPGWLFYAAVNFGPNGGLFHDLPAFNAYVARIQSILQSGQSDNDVLLYWPVHDIWQSDGGNLLMQFTVHDQSKWLWKTRFYDVAMKMRKSGYDYDAISDELLSKAHVVSGKIQVSEKSGGGSYQVIVVPGADFIPIATYAKLDELAHAGAKVIVLDTLPGDVPGLGDLEHRRGEFKEIDGRLRSAIDNGTIHYGANVVTGLSQVGGISREPMVETGLQFVRREREDGHDYFLVNRGTNAFDGWLPLGKPAAAALLMDPRFPDRIGAAAVRQDDQLHLPQIYVQLRPGESCILRTFTEASLEAPKWVYAQTSESPRPIEGKWSVHFLEGGPALPADYQTNQLASWTTRDDPEAKRFAGTARYTIEFDRPGGENDAAAVDWRLDLGKVCESARVTLNGHELGTLFSKPFDVTVGRFLQPGKNSLQIDVTNVAANRIADLDRRGVKWKAFHEINFVNKSYKPFDASQWPLRDSGLIGPITLTPLKSLDPTAIK